MTQIDTRVTKYREITITELTCDSRGDSVYLPPIMGDGRRPRNDLFLMGKAVAENLGYSELPHYIQEIISE